MNYAEKSYNCKFDNAYTQLPLSVQMGHAVHALCVESGLGPLVSVESEGRHSNVKCLPILSLHPEGTPEEGGGEVCAWCVYVVHTHVMCVSPHVTTGRLQ